jgi:hypothetical protein
MFIGYFDKCLLAFNISCISKFVGNAVPFLKSLSTGADDLFDLLKKKLKRSDHLKFDLRS